MTVVTISRNKIKIGLTDDEIAALFGGYENIDYSNPRSKLAFNLLLREALPEAGFALDSEKLMIEVRPAQKGGCEIYLTRLYSEGRRFRKTGSGIGYVFTFNCSENLISAVCELYRRERTRRINSSLYKMPFSYRLTVKAGLSFQAMAAHLREYCDGYSQSEAAVSYTEEYGTPIICENAVEEMGRCFIKGS